MISSSLSHKQKADVMRGANKDTEMFTSSLQKFFAWLLFLGIVLYVLCTLNFVSFPWLPLCTNNNRNLVIKQFDHELSIPKPSIEETLHVSAVEEKPKPQNSSTVISVKTDKTELKHLVFGIAASAKLWEQRKNYIKQWWRPSEMRGFVWLDKKVKEDKSETSNNLPILKISASTKGFPYRNRKGHPSAIRLSRIVSEMVRMGLEDVRWFVMGDDDTWFVPDNLVRVLEKYDHNQFYYIGSLSESHIQNIEFSYSMAYGGGGFAISYALAKEIEKMQDRCIYRYPQLYGSDDRMQACMAEIGVPLTKHPGFHQFDVYGSVTGLLTSHPVAPLLSLHHLDIIDPIFPNMTRTQSLHQLSLPLQFDSASLMQQAICYDKKKFWTISTSWGYAVQIIRAYIPPRELERPSKTFINWYRKMDYNTSYPFNTRLVDRSGCQNPFVYYLSNAWYDESKSQVVTEYTRHWTQPSKCRWKIKDPGTVQRVLVYKTPDPLLWDRAPRRNCCRVLPSNENGTYVLEVGVCREGEIGEIYNS